MEGRKQKQVSVGTARGLLQILWPDFIQESGCVFAGFHGDSTAPPNNGSRTEWECFVNHTHVLDEFANDATFEHRESVSENLDAIEEIYDESHPDFLAACEVGRMIARMWAIKLKFDFPDQHFRVYYTQYDNPIVRFHKVRAGERVWLSDEELELATDSSFWEAMIFDTNRLELPAVKRRPTV